MSGNHTPVPWEYVHEATEYGTGKEDITFGHISQKGGNKYEIAAMVVDVPNGRANGEFIVTAVNSYASSQAEIERLRAALSKVANEVFGLSAFEAELRSVMGNTNWSVLRQRAEEARAALSGSKE